VDRLDDLWSISETFSEKQWRTFHLMTDQTWPLIISERFKRVFSGFFLQVLLGACIQAGRCTFPVLGLRKVPLTC